MDAGAGAPILGPCGSIEGRAMVKGIIVTGAVIAALMAGIKDGRMLRVAGLTASCTVAQRYADGSELDACKPGKLEGRPDLARRGCTDAGIVGPDEYWRCPAPQQAGP